MAKAKHTVSRYQEKQEKKDKVRNQLQKLQADPAAQMLTQHNKQDTCTHTYRFFCFVFTNQRDSIARKGYFVFVLLL